MSSTTVAKNIKGLGRIPAPVTSQVIPTPRVTIHEGRCVEAASIKADDTAVLHAVLHTLVTRALDIVVGSEVSI